MRFTHNTFYEAHNDGSYEYHRIKLYFNTTSYCLISFDAAVSDPSIFTLNDNIVVVGDYWWVTDSSRGMQITQNHNLFQLLNSTTQLGFDSDGLGMPLI